MKHKYQQQKSLARMGFVAALAVTVSTLVSGLAQIPEVYAAENPVDKQVYVALAQEGDLTEEEARQAAEKLVTTIKRLEVTPKYQEMADLLHVLVCMDYGDPLNRELFSCKEEASQADLRRELMKFVPEDKRDEIEGEIDVSAVERFVPYFLQWCEVYHDVNEVYYALRLWQGVEGSGITTELTVDNVAKAMLKTKSTFILWGDRDLEGLWGALMILQADTSAGKLARLHDQLSDTYWMQLVEMTYLAEQFPAVWYYESELSNLLAYYVGTSAYGVPLEDKLALARNLSDWGQAKTLFDALGTACGGFSEEGYEGVWNCYPALTELDENVLAELYEKAGNAATILYPDMMKEMWDYKLVLAELPEAQKAPNSGILGLGKGEMNDLATVVMAGFGGIAAVIGVLTVVRLWTHRKF